MVHAEGGSLLLQLDLIIGLLTLLIGLAIMTNVVRYNWEIITSRIFLKKETFRKYLTYFIYLIIASAGLMSIQHLLEYLLMSEAVAGDVFELAAGLLHMGSMVTMLASLGIWYVFLSELDLDSEKED